MSLADELMNAVRPKIAGKRRVIRDAEMVETYSPRCKPRHWSRQPDSRTGKIRQWAKEQPYLTTAIVAKKWKVANVTASNTLRTLERQGVVREDGYAGSSPRGGGNRPRRWVPV